MKARILETNNFGGLYSDDFIIKNNLIEWNFTEQLPGKEIIKPIFNGAEWVEDATAEEIVIFERSKVPTTITRMNLKIQLLLRNITIDYIIGVINSLDVSLFSDINKQIAIIKLNEAQYFERENADFKLISQICGLTDLDLDEIFTNGNENII